jgi:ABC-type polysaccharide/polyol phosphate export permease
MYLTPIFYPLSIVPEPYRVLVEANPMTYFVEAFRAPIYTGSLPGASVLLGATLSAAVVFLGGAAVFSRYSDRIAYHV